MPRSREIFKWIFGMWMDGGGEFEMDFAEVSSRYLDNEIIDARSRRERRSLERLLKTVEEIDSWEKLHRWFYNDHQAYNCNFDGPREKIDPRTVSSY
jgi:hypothetical protein